MNEGFEATPREKVEYYMGMHIVWDRERGYIGSDARRHVYKFIWLMGRDPESTTGVSTPLEVNASRGSSDA